MDKPPYLGSDKAKSTLQATSLTPQQVVISEEYPVLLTKSKEELEDLLNNGVIYESFLMEVEQVRAMTTLKNDMMINNETSASADYNLLLCSKNTLLQEQELIQLRKTVEEKENELKELYNTLQEKIAMQQNILQRFSPSVLLTKLKSSVQQSDELSEQIASSFLSGELECDQFLKQFKEVRKVYHLRNAKVEKANNQPEILESGL
ncbi:16232_t:CDS:2 [Acaulospora colombiana]|uniref:16232_t:CDS:1 n=1 Tax=Acaulospora colombiana TaxID=27376 RepID=A0ACA9MRM2_9GLOM|nr:16232_t:CDS:2 [Acaulospora colombiana]